MPEWKVKLAVSGAIAIKRNLRLQVEKGHTPFLTTVELKNAAHGVEFQLIARASNSDEANEVAIYFLGQMLDVMCLYLEIPLYLSFSSPEFRPVDNNVKRMVLEQEWQDAFQRGRNYGINRPVFSRALSWYRKGLTSEDPIDRLFAFWLSLEIIGTKYARDNERTRGNRTKNKILDCFDQLWESQETWKVIPNDVAWLDSIHELRNKIAHGVLPVDLETIKNAVQVIPRLRNLASKFLFDWENNGSDLLNRYPKV